MNSCPICASPLAQEGDCCGACGQGSPLAPWIEPPDARAPHVHLTASAHTEQTLRDAEAAPTDAAPATADALGTPAGPTEIPAFARRERRPADGSRIKAWGLGIVDAVDRNRKNTILAVVSLVVLVVTTLVVAPDPAARRDAVTPAVETLPWRTYTAPDDSFRFDAPGEVSERLVNGTAQYRVELAGLAVIVGSTGIPDETPEPIVYLRDVATRTGETLLAAPLDFRENEHDWGVSLDAEYRTRDATIVVRFAYTDHQLWVIEGDIPPSMATNPDTPSRRAFGRVAASFVPFA